MRLKKAKPQTPRDGVCLVADCRTLAEFDAIMAMLNAIDAAEREQERQELQQGNGRTTSTDGSDA